MPDELNPYRSPEGTEDVADIEGAPFATVLSRGFAAAHRAPTGAAWIFVLMVPSQLLGAVMNAVMFDGDFFGRMQQGDLGAGGQVPPEMMTLMGAGCVSCLWTPVMLLGLPWVWGGTAGQIRDRLLSVPLQSFHAHGKRYYTRMLALLGLFIVAVIVVSLPGAIISQIVTMSQAAPGRPMTMDAMRELSRHPANIVANIVGLLLMTAVGTFVYLTASTVAADGCGIREGFTRAFTLCRRHFADVARLFGIYALLLLPFSLVQWTYAQLTGSLVVGVVLSLLSTLYLGYVSVVSFGLAGSLLAARPAAFSSPTSAPSEQPI